MAAENYALVEPMLLEHAVLMGCDVVPSGGQSPMFRRHHTGSDLTLSGVYKIL